MEMSEILTRLADLIGIEPVFWDIFGHKNEASPATKQALLAGMGLGIDDAGAALQSMHALEERPWRRWIAPVVVLRRGEPISVALALPAELASRGLAWTLSGESGKPRQGRMPANAPPEETRDIDGAQVQKVYLPLPDDIADGYYSLTLHDGNRTAGAVVIVAPRRCYMPEWLAGGERKWGVACHAYSLRSAGNWGMGDFSDLAALAGALKGTGCASIGVNPLHSLFPHNPLHASPYSPSSRLFLNPLYIDVTAIPEYAACAKAQKRVQTVKFAKALEKARATNHVDYPAVADLKNQVLEMLHACFEAAHKPGAKATARRKDYDAFVAAGGLPLYRFALYQALCDAHEGRTWRGWPQHFQNPETPEIAAFAKENASRIGYHLYLQWEADRQLGLVAKACSDADLFVGLYRDLAVGVDPNGSDVWGNQGAFANAHVGAPPDQFNAKGQDWGTPPFNPLRLEETAYGDFIAILRANMRHAGALRIDHVMALMHLFWIPSTGDASLGAYVRYPFDALLGILALESQRHRCLVIGEDLGTVPPGFRDRMTAEGVLSYRVLFFERWPEGYLKRPGVYPPLALATPSTHDLPTVAGFWHGTDLALKQELGLVSEDQPAEKMVAERVADRNLLAAALIDQNLLPQDFPLNADLPDAQMRELVLATHRFLGRSSARFMLVNIDDLLLETTQLNLPGTVDEYPNWKRKLSKPVEAVAGDAYLRGSAAAIDADRHAPPSPP